jgi:hypothetical protein
MAFFRFNRDKRGYEHFFLVEPVTNRRGKSRPRVLYWYRTPPNIRVGRAPFDEDVQRALEAQNPTVSFDWRKIIDAPIPSADVEKWRERRRAERAEKAARRIGSTQEEPADDIGDRRSPIAEQESPISDLDIADRRSPIDDLESPIPDLEPASPGDRTPASELMRATPTATPAPGAMPGGGDSIRKHRRRRRGRGRRPDAHTAAAASAPAGAAPQEPAQPAAPPVPAEPIDTSNPTETPGD